MPSAVATGSYYKSKTKRWLEAQGYVVAFLERVLYLQGAHGLIPIKRDQYGADLEAKSSARTIYAQVKGGESARSQLAAARAEFAKYPLAPCDEQWIVTRQPRAREPEIYVVAVGPQPAQHSVIVPKRRTPKTLPLFSRSA